MVLVLVGIATTLALALTVALLWRRVRTVRVALEDARGTLEPAIGQLGRDAALARDQLDAVAGRSARQR